MTPAHWSAGAAAALLGLGAPLHAQTVLELRPAAYTVLAGEPIKLSLLSGKDPQPWPAVQWLFVRGEGTQENRDDPPAADAAGDVSLPAPGPGVAVVGIDFEPETTTHPARTLREFISARGATAFALPQRDEITAAWTRSGTALLRVAPAGQASITATNKTGQAAEIRPLMDPTVAVVGSDIPLRAYAAGDKVAKARILATPRATGKPQELRTNDSGIANLHITHSGPWLIELHHISKGEGTDLAITSGTLAFEVPAPPKPAPAPREDRP